MFGRATITLGIGPHSSFHLSSPCAVQFGFEFDTSLINRLTAEITVQSFFSVSLLEQSVSRRFSYVAI